MRAQRLLLSTTLNVWRQPDVTLITISRFAPLLPSLAGLEPMG